MTISLFPSALAGDDARPKIDKDLARKATTPTQAVVHVVFTEIVKSTEQKDWTDKYNASVEILSAGKSIGKFRGSTLPNDKPPVGNPALEYSVLISTSSLKPLIGECHYAWSKGVRAEKDKDGNARPCLRLTAKVPTLNVGTAREIDKIASFIVNGAVQGNFNFAESILIHEGYKANWRGSAGCLTIHPDDAAKFFAAIPDKTTGTLSLNRGIHDDKKGQSYNY